MPKLTKNGKEYEVSDWQVQLLAGKPGWSEVREKSTKPPKEKPELPKEEESEPTA